jgi:AraC family transcriptional regulator
VNGAHGSFVDHYTQGRFAPYVRERRLAGSAGYLLEAAQPAGDFSDPPTTDLILTVALSTASGEFDFGPGRFTRTIPSGQMVLTSPGVATTIVIDRPHLVRFLAIPAEYLRPYLQVARDGDLFDFERLQVGGFENPFILDVVNRLWAEAERGDEVSRLFADGAILALTAELLREAARPALIARGGLAAWQLRRVVEYMRANLASDVSLGELAELVSLSPHHFCRAFKGSTGLSPHSWFTRCRIERAKEMIGANPSVGLTEVALCVGFGSQSAFGTAFRRVTGTTPSAWRRERLS